MSTDFGRNIYEILSLEQINYLKNTKNFSVKITDPKGQAHKGYVSYEDSTEFISNIKNTLILIREQYDTYMESDQPLLPKCYTKSNGPKTYLDVIKKISAKLPKHGYEADDIFLVPKNRIKSTHAYYLYTLTLFYADDQSIPVTHLRACRFLNRSLGDSAYFYIVPRNIIDFLTNLAPLGIEYQDMYVKTYNFYPSLTFMELINQNKIKSLILSDSMPQNIKKLCLLSDTNNSFNISRQISGVSNQNVSSVLLPGQQLTPLIESVSTSDNQPLLSNIQTQRLPDTLHKTICKAGHLEIRHDYKAQAEQALSSQVQNPLSLYDENRFNNTARGQLYRRLINNQSEEQIRMRAAALKRPRSPSLHSRKR